MKLVQLGDEKLKLGLALAMILTTVHLCAQADQRGTIATKSEDSQERRESTQAIQSQPRASTVLPAPGGPSTHSSPPATAGTDKGLAPLDVVQSATQTASLIIELSAFVVAGALFIFTLIGATLGFYYRTLLKQRAEALAKQTESAQTLCNKLEAKLAFYDVRFDEFLEQQEKSALFEEKAKQQKTVLLNPNATSEQIVPAITYLGERGTARDIPLIMKAAQRFPPDQELLDFAIQAVMNLSTKSRLEEKIIK